MIPATQKSSLKGLYSVKYKSGGPEKKASEIAVACEFFLEGGSGAVVLVEYLALVDAHDPVESNYEE